ncbi:MAG: complex I NDUFA9 subunit family protein [Rhodospirillaceae bacterium]
MVNRLNADRLVTIFGGSGFVGRHLVNKLASHGWRIRVAVRDVEAAKFVKPLGDLGQISVVAADLLNEGSVQRAIAGADAVVNLVGILHEGGKATFSAIHAEGAGRVARAAKAAGVTTLVHMSALGADRASNAAYARTKAEGEEQVRAAFPTAIIMRPSVIFGPEDGFYNRFAAMARYFPVLPYFAADAPALRRDKGGLPVLDLFGEGGPKFQPVYVGDVAEAFVKALEDGQLAGKTFELGGPQVLSLRDVMTQVSHETRRNRLVLPLPMWVARLQAAFLQFLPNPPLTPDQVRLMERPNVVSGDFPGFADLGIQPEPAEAILPQYMDRFRPMHRQIRRLGRRGV